MVEPDEWRVVSATLMTSERIEAYGGMQFEPLFLQAAADHLNAGNVPWQVNHDARTPLRVRNMRAYVTVRDDGVTVLRAEFEMFGEDTTEIEEHPGVSMAVRVPLPSREGVPLPQGAIRLAGDHAWFPDELLEEVEQILAGSVPARAERAYQFSFVPDPQLYLEMTLAGLQVLAGGVAGNALYDSIKALFRRRSTPAGGDATSPNRIDIEISDGPRTAKAIVETASEDVATKALEVLGDAVRAVLQDRSAGNELSNRVLVWDESAEEWRPVDP